MQNFKEAQKQYKTTPAYAVQRFNLARSNLLVALALTVVNILIGCLNADIYMLFSISFPYFMFDVTDLVWSIPAILVLAGYVLLYLYCKKKPGLMIVAMVAFIFDFLFLIGYTMLLVGMFEEISFGNFILDYVTHIWVLVYLIIGTKFAGRYKAAVTANPELTEGSLFKNAELPPVNAPAAETAWDEQVNTSAEPAWDAPAEPAWTEAPTDDSTDNQ